MKIDLDIVQWIAGLIIAAVVGLVGWLLSMERRLAGIDQRHALLNQQVKSMDIEMHSLSSKMDRVLEAVGDTRESVIRIEAEIGISRNKK